MDDYTVVIADAAQFDEEVSQDEIVKGPQVGHASCDTDECTRGYSLSWETPMLICLCTTPHSRKEGGCLDTPTN